MMVKNHFVWIAKVKILGQCHQMRFYKNNKERRKKMNTKKYKIKYQDTQTSYYLDVKFNTEDQADKYIEENNLNGGYSFFTVEYIR